MNGRGLLELAAAAAGIEYEYCRLELGGCLMNKGHVSRWWNPLTDDGDALRLAVKLGIKTEINHRDGHVVATAPSVAVCVEESSVAPVDTQHYRRAIVRAAAEIGKTIMIYDVASRNAREFLHGDLDGDPLQFIRDLLEENEMLREKLDSLPKEAVARPKKNRN